MCERVKLTPLTPEEQAFAEENHSALEWCMKVQGLDEDLYDVAAIGYLRGVKKWFVRPEIRKWSFKTVVYQEVRSCVGAERKKQERRIKTLSLDAVIPGTEGMTFGDTVTEENMRYLKLGGERKTKKKMAAKATYDAAVPVASRRSGKASEEVKKLIEFLGSDHYAMCLEFSDEKEAEKKVHCLRSWKRFQKRNDFKIRKVNKMVYIEKLDEGPKKGER